MDPHNCIRCQVMTINEGDFCSEKCEKAYLEQQERSWQILECLRKICNAAYVGIEHGMAKEVLGDTLVPIDIKLINEGRKLLQWPELKPNGQ